VTGRLEHFGVTGDPRAWVRVANGLLDRIASGEFKPHDLLPVIDDLCTDAGLLSRHPATRAFKALEDRGVVRWFRGCGYKVMPEAFLLAASVAAGPVAPALGATAEAVLLEALRWAWAGWYRINGTSGSFEAWRLDGSGSVHAATVEELRDAIREDWPKYTRVL
jgi:hypothetical protein